MMSLLVLVVPIAAISLALIVWSAFGIVMYARRGRAVRIAHCVALVCGLAIADAFLCLYFILSAALGHSQHAKAIANWYCLISFVIIVLIPAGSALLYRRYQISVSDDPAVRAAPGAGQRLQRALARAGEDKSLLRVAKRAGLGILFAGLVIGAVLGLRAAAGPLLIYCSGAGNSAVVSLLLDLGVSPDQTDRGGETPLILAAKNGDSATAKILLSHGARVDFCDHGWTPLISAAVHNQQSLVRLLLAHGADVNYRDRFGSTALILASQEGHADVVQTLLDYRPNVEAKDNDGRTAAMVATAAGRERILALLAGHRARGATATPSPYTAPADVSAIAAERSVAVIDPLLQASRRGDAARVQDLLEQGADVNAKDPIGSTALTCAAYAGAADVVQLLLDRGADVNSPSNHQVTPLMEACKHGHLAVARLLLSRGADVNAKSKKGWTALMWAAETGHKDMVNLLLEHAADAGAKDGIGRTALSVATAKGNQEVANLLLKHEKNQSGERH